jgi:phospholipid/cholesterol/gamma-HCH transport system substrate-binding protein
MESRAYALITGLFVLGIAGCIVAWANWLSKTPIARTEYRVVATGVVSGLNPEAQVRYRGIGVGRVSHIALDAKDPRRILINIEVDHGIPVTRGTFAQLGMEGITGIAYVHLQDDYRDMTPKEKAADGVVEVPLRPSFFDAVTDNAEAAIKDARELMQSLNALLTPDNRKKVASLLVSLENMSASLDEASAKLPQTIARVDSVLSEENRRNAAATLASANEAAKNLPELTREMQQLVKDGRALVAQVDKLSVEAHGTTGSVREDTLPRVNALADSVDRSAQRVGRLALQLDRDPQSAIFGRKPGRPGPGEPGFQ